MDKFVTTIVSLAQLFQGTCTSIGACALGLLCVSIVFPPFGIIALAFWFIYWILGNKPKKVKRNLAKISESIAQSIEKETKSRSKKRKKKRKNNQ